MRTGNTGPAEMAPTRCTQRDTAQAESARPPVASVVIPTFHREELVVEAIRSALEGTTAALEVIVIDDSPDRSAERAVRSITDSRVRYEAMPMPSDGRPALVRNRGIDLASGSYLYFLDDDDRVVPGALEELVKALQTTGAGVAYGNVESFGPDQQVREQYQRWWDWAARASRRVRWSSWLTTGVIMFRGTLIINSTCMIRREVAVELGGYDVSLPVYEDVDFFTRGIRQFGHVYVDRPVLRYSTGLASIIHDLHGDFSLVADTNARVHAEYRHRHGVVDYHTLQLLSKLLPLGRHG